MKKVTIRLLSMVIVLGFVLCNAQMLVHAETPTITYTLNGGNWKTDYEAASNYTEGQSLTLPTSDNVVREGYAFVGWTATNDVNDVTYITEINTDATGNKEYYAQWKQYVAQIGDTSYFSIEDALKHGTNYSSKKPSEENIDNPTIIKLIANDNENVTIPSTRYIKLDLNGYVLSGDGSTSVIINKGLLIINDTVTTNNTHYFKVNTNGLWVLDDSLNSSDYSFDSTNGLQKAGLATSEIPSSGETIIVTGGCITGGKATYGGGINNAANSAYTPSLTISSGNVIGNTARFGGGIYSTNSQNSGKTETYIATFKMDGGNAVGNVANYENSTCGGGLYLNGNSIISSGLVSYNTCSSAATGNNIRSYGGGIYLGALANVSSFNNMKICGNTASHTGNSLLAYGGGIANLSSNEINIYNTLIDNNTVVVSKETSDNNVCAYGGGIYNNGKINLTGTTTISNNSAIIATQKHDSAYRQAFGGGVYVSTNGVLNVASSTSKICNNLAKSTHKSQGGGVYMGSGAKFTITAGKVTENKVNAPDNEDEGGGVCVTNSQCVFTVGGSANISNNKKTDDSLSNVYLRIPEGDEALINISTETAPTTSGDNKMVISVTVADTYKDTNSEYQTTEFPQPITTTDEIIDGVLNCFKSDNTTYEVKFVTESGAEVQEGYVYGHFELAVVPKLVDDDTSDFTVDLETGVGYKEFTKGNTSSSTIHIGDMTLDSIYKPSNKYTGILVKNGDAVLVEGTDYTVTSGSVKVNLSKTYLDKLNIGTYTIKVYINETDVATVQNHEYEFEVTIKIKDKQTSNDTYKVVDTSVF